MDTDGVGSARGVGTVTERLLDRIPELTRLDVYRKVPKDLTQPTYTGAVVVGLDIQDEMGRHEVGHIDNSMKVPHNHGYGCRFEGEFTINKGDTADPHYTDL
ncbi:endoplasmic reticulum-Golgi intermediate compartment protein 1-like isoform X1 [Salvelinus alpinus]|uniref:endoplasmic reticulum-Golgi intermediate compartment protein 1-like isoform X1 n=1 Tax=Salvelinus alpinus TaxID=8036 RepID=UPI0039FCFBF9